LHTNPGALKYFLSDVLPGIRGRRGGNQRPMLVLPAAACARNLLCPTSRRPPLRPSAPASSFRVPRAARSSGYERNATLETCNRECYALYRSRGRAIRFSRGRVEDGQPRSRSRAARVDRLSASRARSSRSARQAPPAPQLSCCWWSRPCWPGVPTASASTSGADKRRRASFRQGKTAAASTLHGCSRCWTGKRSRPSCA
jgi:hypothetical protein